MLSLYFYASQFVCAPYFSNIQVHARARAFLDAVRNDQFASLVDGAPSSASSGDALVLVYNHDGDADGCGAGNAPATHFSRALHVDSGASLASALLAAPLQPHASGVAPLLCAPACVVVCIRCCG